jgi:hypothetical protein
MTHAAAVAGPLASLPGGSVSSGGTLPRSGSRKEGTVEMEDAGAAPAENVPREAVPEEDVPATGDRRVDEALGRLSELAGLPVTEHPAVFGHIHQRLAEVLGDLGPGTPGR